MADGLNKYRNNPINPNHYNKGTYEAINVIEAWGLGFSLGNAVKYICRAGKKEGNTAKQDLQKAVWYLEREIERINKEEYSFGDLKPPELVEAIKDYTFPQHTLGILENSRDLEYRTNKPAVMCDPNYPDFVENTSFEEKKYIPKSHENSMV